IVSATQHMSQPENGAAPGAIAAGVTEFEHRVADLRVNTVGQRRVRIRTRLHETKQGEVVSTIRAEKFCLAFTASLQDDLYPLACLTALVVVVRLLVRYVVLRNDQAFG